MIELFNDEWFPSDEIQYNVTFLTGEKEFKEPEWTLRKTSHSEGVLESDFVSLNGDYDELTRSAVAGGIKFKVIK